MESGANTQEIRLMAVRSSFMCLLEINIIVKKKKAVLEAFEITSKMRLRFLSDFYQYLSKLFANFDWIFGEILIKS